MTRIAVGVEYAGESFCGWQAQQGLSTVQAEVEKALSFVANEPIEVFCAGRTDTGVHGSGQVVHFDTSAVRAAHNWVKGCHTKLPPSISIAWVKEVSEDFHARFSALYRRYQYFIYNTPERSALYAKRATFVHEPLDAERMQLAAHYFLGVHDFSAFRSSRCESKTPIRNVMNIEVKRYKSFIIIDIKANAFLHHMVRNITGSLLAVGRHEKDPQWIEALLLQKERRLAAETAPPDGLYLSEVGYPDHFQIPIKTLQLWGG